MGGNAAYDVVIVGGRPSGAALAAHLGAKGVRVLVVDRATFPSTPNVPSSPTVHPGTMRLLDELGIDEARYGNAHAKMPAFSVAFGTWWDTVLRMPAIGGRDYVYGVDRASFDHALWENLARYPSVERRTGFAMTELLRDGDGRVSGIVGHAVGGAEERIAARCVVGADGRFSLVARKAGAAVTEEESKHLSTVYYADWEGVAPTRDGVHGGQLCTTGRGLDVLFFAMPGGRWSVNTHARADRVDVEGDAQRYYETTLRSLPEVARRLAGARQVSRVVGMKRIGNGYRTTGGPGWVLLGDALHYKDPVDGQGIYDALVGAKLLGAALGAWHAGELSWDAALARYEADIRAETRPMYLATIGRLKRELYEEPPEFVIKTVIRWTMTDPAYQRQFMRLIGRDVAPDGWMSPGLMAGAMLRGVGRDVAGLWTRRPPNA